MEAEWNGNNDNTMMFITGFIIFMLFVIAVAVSSNNDVEKQYKLLKEKGYDVKIIEEGAIKMCYINITNEVQGCNSKYKEVRNEEKQEELNKIYASVSNSEEVKE